MAGNGLREGRIMRLLPCLCTALLVAACSAQPQVTAGAGSSAPRDSRSSQTASKPEANSAANTVPVTSDTVPVASTGDPSEPVSTTDPEFLEVAKSYKVEEKDGQKLYCRSEVMLGSRLPVQYCITEAQLLERVRSTSDLKRRMSLPKASPCSTNTMGCSGS